MPESRQEQPMIDSDDYGYPPRTRWQDYARVLLQLLLISVLDHNGLGPDSQTRFWGRRDRAAVSDGRTHQSLCGWPI